MRDDGLLKDYLGAHAGSMALYDEAARVFRDGTNEILRRKGINGRLYGRSIVHVYPGQCERESFDIDYDVPCRDVAALMNVRCMPVIERLNLHLLQCGVASLRGSLFVFSAAHTDRDVGLLSEALAQSLDAMVKKGSLPRDLIIGWTPGFGQPAISLRGRCSKRKDGGIGVHVKASSWRGRAMQREHPAAPCRYQIQGASERTTRSRGEQGDSRSHLPNRLSLFRKEARLLQRHGLQLEKCRFHS